MYTEGTRVHVSLLLMLLMTTRYMLETDGRRQLCLSSYQRSWQSWVGKFSLTVIGQGTPGRASCDETIKALPQRRRLYRGCRRIILTTHTPRKNKQKSKRRRHCVTPLPSPPPWINLFEQANQASDQAPLLRVDRPCRCRVRTRRR